MFLITGDAKQEPNKKEKEEEGKGRHVVVN
jgi:hypothetical protein